MGKYRLYDNRFKRRCGNKKTKKKKGINEASVDRGYPETSMVSRDAA